MSKIEEKLEWIHHQMADGALLHFNAEDALAIPIEKVEICHSFEGDQYLIANDDQLLNITDVDIYGYNPKYELIPRSALTASEDVYQCLMEKRYPVYNDREKYIPAITNEGEFQHEFNRLLQKLKKS